MSLPNATKPILAGGATTAYQVSRSLRFNSADSAYLARTPSVTSSTRTLWTYSGWVKLNLPITTYGHALLSSGTSSSNYVSVFIDPTSQLWVLMNGYYKYGGPLIRDVSAWYHFVVVYDSNQSAGSRIKMYLNGVQVTTTVNSEITSNYSSPLGVNTNPMYVGRIGNNAGWSTFTYTSANLAENIWVDGQALTPSSFAETNATTGQWVPKAYAGTYGTNGFKLNFSDNSAATAATLGADSSGNGNNFTPTNLSVTAGVNNDSLTDTPTQYGSDTGAGGEVRGNYCTLNPAIPSASGITNGNLDATGAAQGTFDITSGSWYWESTASATAAGGIINSAGTAYTTAIASGVTRGFRYASSTTTLESTINGSSWTTISAAVVGQPFPYVLTGATSSNFGQRAFAYTAPSGYKALCVQNLSTPTIVLPSAAFDAKLYTGTGSSQSITGLGFNPDLVWIKSRSAATDNTLYDSVRGAQARLESNNTDTEVTADNGLTAFNATGFTVNTLAQVNTSAATYVGWCWDESVSAGFDIVTYTGDIASNRDVAHSLGVAPKLIIVKDRSSNGVNNNWSIWHTSITSGHNMYFDTGASFAISGTSYGGIGTAHTSSTFRLQNGSSSNQTVNESGDLYVAYLWAEVAGFSKFGSYTGNGSSDGPFVHTEFRPSFVLVKMSSSTGNWTMLDDVRKGYNVDNDPLYPNLSNAEGTTDLIDILSNGFKVRTTDATFNTSSGTYIFAAFAESPFKYANAR